MSNEASASDRGDSLPPSSVSFSVDALEQLGDDHSDLTGPHSDEDDDTREDDYAIERAADPNFYRAEDGANPLETTEGEQERFRLKLQIERQQERLYLLSSKLSHCEAENEALKTEKAILVDELARSATASQSEGPPAPGAARQGWFSKGGGGSNGGGAGGGGSMQLLVDANARLMTDNARLQALANVARKSLKSHVEESRRGDAEREKKIRSLRGENGRLREALAAALDPSKPDSRLSHSARTARTRSLTSSLSGREPTDDPTPVGASSLHSATDVALSGSLRSIPEQELPAARPGDGPGGGGVRGSEEEEAPNLRLVSRLPAELVQRASFTKRAANAMVPDGDKVVGDAEDYPRRRSEPEELLVDFGEASRTRDRPRYRQSKTAGQRLTQSFTLGVTMQPVKFGEDEDGPLNHSFTQGTTIRATMNSGGEATTVKMALNLGGQTAEPTTSGDREPANLSRDAIRALARGAARPPSPSGGCGGGESHGGRRYADLLAEFGEMLAQKTRGAERRLSQSLPQSLGQLPVELFQRSSFNRKAADAASPDIDAEDHRGRRSEPKELPVNFRAEGNSARRRPRYRQSKMADPRLTQSYTLGVTTQPLKFGADTDGSPIQNFVPGNAVRTPQKSGGEAAESATSGDLIEGPTSSAGGAPSGGSGGMSHSRSYTDFLAEIGEMLVPRGRGARRRPSRSPPRGPADVEGEGGEGLLVDFDAARRIRGAARRSSVEF